MACRMRWNSFMAGPSCLTMHAADASCSTQLPSAGVASTHSAAGCSQLARGLRIGACHARSAPINQNANGQAVGLGRRACY
jgi:hypothetical protein